MRRLRGSRAGRETLGAIRLGHSLTHDGILVARDPYPGTREQSCASESIWIDRSRQPWFQQQLCPSTSAAGDRHAALPGARRPLLLADNLGLGHARATRRPADDRPGCTGTGLTPPPAPAERQAVPH